MSKPILKLTSSEQKTLDVSRDLMLKLLMESRVKGECRDAAALRETLRDGEALIRRIYKLAAVPV
jgi:hypothetical protein